MSNNSNSSNSVNITPLLLSLQHIRPAGNRNNSAVNSSKVSHSNNTNDNDAQSINDNFWTRNPGLKNNATRNLPVRPYSKKDIGKTLKQPNTVIRAFQPDCSLHDNNFFDNSLNSAVFAQIKKILSPSDYKDFLKNKDDLSSPLIKAYKKFGKKTSFTEEERDALYLAWIRDSPFLNKNYTNDPLKIHVASANENSSRFGTSDVSKIYAHGLPFPFESFNGNEFEPSDLSGLKQSLQDISKVVNIKLVSDPRKANVVITYGVLKKLQEIVRMREMVAGITSAPQIIKGQIHALVGLEKAAISIYNDIEMHEFLHLGAGHTRDKGPEGIDLGRTNTKMDMIRDDLAGNLAQRGLEPDHMLPSRGIAEVLATDGRSTNLSAKCDQALKSIGMIDLYSLQRMFGAPQGEECTLLPQNLVSLTQFSYRKNLGGNNHTRDFNDRVMANHNLQRITDIELNEIIGAALIGPVRNSFIKSVKGNKTLIDRYDRFTNDTLGGRATASKIDEEGFMSIGPSLRDMLITGLRKSNNINELLNYTMSIFEKKFEQDGIRVFRGVDVKNKCVNIKPDESYYTTKQKAASASIALTLIGSVFIVCQEIMKRRQAQNSVQNPDPDNDPWGLEMQEYTLGNHNGNPNHATPLVHDTVENDRQQNPALPSTEADSFMSTTSGKSTFIGAEGRRIEKEKRKAGKINYATNYRPQNNDEKRFVL